MASLGVMHVSTLLAVLASASGQMLYYPNEAVTPWPNVDCATFAFTNGCSCNDNIDGIELKVTRGYSGTPDTFDCPGCAALGIMQERVAWRGALLLTGTAPLSDYITAITSVTFTTASWAGSDKTLQYTLARAYYSPDTESLYAWTEGPVTWEAAQAASADPAKDIWGLVGYLATITSPIENSVVSSQVYTSTGFLGASDYAGEGVYRWVTGPEGCPPYTGTGALRSACDLGFPLDPTMPCGGPDCGNGERFAVTDDLTNATAITPVTYERFIDGREPDNGAEVGTPEHWISFTALGWVDTAFQNDTHAAGYYTEWGGVGALCIDKANIYGTADLTPRDVDECVDNCPTCVGTTCSDAGQSCDDPTKAFLAKATWECGCVAPYVGPAATAMVAACTLDECTEACPTCEADFCKGEDQDCQDPDQTAEGNWQCTCILPETGPPATMMKATCIIDECLYNTSLCSHCAGRTCSDMLQACVDTDTALDSINNWLCVCAGGAVGVPERLAPAMCTLDECAAMCPTCAGGECSDAMQECTDFNQSVFATSDWNCTCVAPRVGEATAKRARCDLDECASVCDSCSMGTCNATGQTCEDRNIDDRSLNDWSCSCVAPATGTSAFGKPARCTLDECVNACPSCAGATCTDADQDCTDADSDSQSLGDWVCVCKLPLVGGATAAAASCVLDECVADCPTCEGSICADAGQVCNDTNTLADALGDWNCTCTGSDDTMRGGPAECSLDECEAQCATCEDSQCERSGQECTDPVALLSSLSDWICRCLPPFIGEQRAAPADCVVEVYDECARVCATCVNDTCSIADQDCFDPNTLSTALGDWQCSCRSPFVGNRTGAPADCWLDECATCRGCAGTTCSDAGQRCRDLNMSTASTGDWQCECIAPRVGVGATMAAACELDECVVPDCGTCAGTTCSAVAQDCDDPNILATSLGDWTCNCRAPRVGSATGIGALCIKEECVETCDTCAGTTCKVASQECFDPDISDTSLADWSCVCLPPTTGERIAAAATCILDECVTDCGSCSQNICVDAGQDCRDLDRAPASLGDWQCECRAPLFGSQPRGVAGCVPDDLDECEDGPCATCAGTVCSDAGQTCMDPGPKGASLSDWVCVCAPPAEGSEVGRPAVCKLDECTTACSTCAGPFCELGSQLCEDPVKTTDSLMDWTCNCVAPNMGSAVRALVDVCIRDECVADCATCEGGACGAVGQRCRDANTSLTSLQDWVCDCVPPFNGSQLLAPANCTVDTKVPPTDVPATLPPATGVPTDSPSRFTLTPTGAPGASRGASAADDEGFFEQNIILLLLIILILIVCLIAIWVLLRRREKEKAKEEARHVNSEMIETRGLYSPTGSGSAYLPPDSPGGASPLVKQYSAVPPPPPMPMRGASPPTGTSFADNSSLAALHQKVDRIETKLESMNASSTMRTPPPNGLGGLPNSHSDPLLGAMYTTSNEALEPNVPRDPMLAGSPQLDPLDADGGGGGGTDPHATFPTTIRLVPDSVKRPGGVGAAGMAAFGPPAPGLVSLDRGGGGRFAR